MVTTADAMVVDWSANIRVVDRLQFSDVPSFVVATKPMDRSVAVPIRHVPGVRSSLRVVGCCCCWVRWWWLYVKWKDRASRVDNTAARAEWCDAMSKFDHIHLDNGHYYCYYYYLDDENEAAERKRDAIFDRASRMVVAGLI